MDIKVIIIYLFFFKKSFQKDIYLPREVFLNQVERCFVDHLVLVRLQSLNLVQSAAFFNHETQLVRLPNFVPGLVGKHTPAEVFHSHLVTSNDK